MHDTLSAGCSPPCHRAFLSAGIGGMPPPHRTCRATPVAVQQPPIELPEKMKKEKMHGTAIGPWRGYGHLIANLHNLVAGPIRAGERTVVLGAADFCFTGSAARAVLSCPGLSYLVRCRHASEREGRILWVLIRFLEDVHDAIYVGY